MSFRILGLLATIVLTSSVAYAGDVKVTLSGAEEVPPVTTSASGSGATARSS